MKLYRFSGATLLSIDEKSRLLVPADVRRKLDGQDTDVWVIKIGNNGKLWLYPERFYDTKVYDAEAELEIDEIEPTPEQIDRMIARSADIQRVAMDKAGRILLPELLMSLTGLAKGEVVLLGVFNHLQLWTKAAYAERQRQKSVEKASESSADRSSASNGTSNSGTSDSSGESNT